MDPLIKERLSILKRLKGRQQAANKEKKASTKWLKIEMVARIVISVVSILIVMSIIVTDLFSWPFFILWNTASLFVIVTFASLIYTPTLIYQYMARLHVDFLERQRTIHQGAYYLNTQLVDLVEEMNETAASRLVTICFAVVILAVGIYHYLLDGQDIIWQYTKIPIVVFYAIQIVKFLRLYPRFRDNIKAVEGGV